MPNQLPPEFEGLRSREMFARELSLRSQSVDESNRSFEAVVASETPALMFDYRSYDMIDEVLLSGGGQFPDQVPLLPNHRKYDVLDVIGSAREFRRDGDRWVGRGYVANPVGENDEVEKIWRRVAEGHLRAVSIGYRVLNHVDIPAGKRQRINDRMFEAGQRTLRVSTEWQVHELSLTPIGADSLALIRSGCGYAPIKRSYFAK